MPIKKSSIKKKKPTKYTKIKAKISAVVEALQASQAQVTVNAQAEVHACPADAASPDPGPQADTGHASPGEAEAAVDDQYILF
ncbi:hypothetical protein DPMN_193909 [Dreissena polymorpha]|uniref:Uncharacterized protein n=1 Tax=Dreissena polymorpha TaxID=45954 RepID=A0A9D3Y199_DREPO|nr:hypothetical protein DPMN_193909 [Dreissena polymorpha]